MKSGRGSQEESYVGLASDFKRRFYKHKESLQVKNPKGSTTLSTYFWKEKEDGGDPAVSWKILEANILTFNPVTKTCNLCLREKYNIVLNPHLASLNSGHDIFAHCKHMGYKLIDKPQDWNPLGPRIFNCMSHYDIVCNFVDHLCLKSKVEI